jgi:hypothetical protein
MSLIRIFCQLPYLDNGKTDAIQDDPGDLRQRLTHEIRHNPQQNRHEPEKHVQVKPDSLRCSHSWRWCGGSRPEAASKLSADPASSLRVSARATDKVRKP